MLYELIDMTEWKTKKVILEELVQCGFGKDERGFRSMVKANNEMFFNHETDVFIAHSSKGYKATKDAEEILKSLEDNHKRSINMLYEESKIRKALGENFNFHLDINDEKFLLMDSEL